MNIAETIKSAKPVIQPGMMLVVTSTPWRKMVRCRCFVCPVAFLKIASVGLLKTETR